MLLIFPNLFLGRDMLVQERGAYEGALQVLTKCNLLRARSSETEGAKLVCQMEGACCKRVSYASHFALKATLIF